LAGRLVGRWCVIAGAFAIAGFFACHPPAQGATAPQDDPVVPDVADAPAAAQSLKDWYVSPTGSDSAAGTSAQPFRTISRAIAAVGPGERILVNAGTYAERVRITGTVRAGTATAPIRLQGVGKPKIVPAAGGYGSLVQIEKPYWTVDGFEVDVHRLVLSRARRALEIGCDGIVSSGLEARALREHLGEKLLIVTPGGSGSPTIAL